MKISDNIESVRGSGNIYRDLDSLSSDKLNFSG
jgi:hypothetical protein